MSPTEFAEENPTVSVSVNKDPGIPWAVALDDDNDADAFEGFGETLEDAWDEALKGWQIAHGLYEGPDDEPAEDPDEDDGAEPAPWYDADNLATADPFDE